MQRVISTSERRIWCGGGAPVAVPSNTSTDALPDQTKLPSNEIAYRYVQNVGSTPLYYAFGQEASPLNFNGILSPASAVDANGYGPGAQLDCSAHRLRVSVYSVGASGAVATTVLNRADLVQEDVFVKGQTQ